MWDRRGLFAHKTRTRSFTGMGTRLAEMAIFEYHSKSVTTPGHQFDDFLCELWQKAMDDGVFRYKIDDTVTTRNVPVHSPQYNTRRATHRRTPTHSTSLHDPFDDKRFNFNKIDKKEILFKLRRHVSEEVEELHSVIANVSPITYCHVLLVPYQLECLPQAMTMQSLRICFELMLLSSRSDMVIVANSLLACASVNHLHYHMMYLDHDLLGKRAHGGDTIVSGCRELLDHPMCGFLLQYDGSSIEQCLQTLHCVICVLMDQNIPHNLFVVKGLSVVNVLLIPRKPSYTKTISSPDTPPFNVAACEVGGFIPVWDKYHELTEQDIVNVLSEKSLTKQEFEKLKESIINKS